MARFPDSHQQLLCALFGRLPALEFARHSPVVADRLTKHASPWARRLQKDFQEVWKILGGGAMVMGELSEFPC
eukprot:5921877-Pyramimonas_sp.AAC.1